MKKQIRVVGCIAKYGDTILMLYRSPKETDPSLWGIPAGKVEEGEDDSTTVIREMFEETGIRLRSNDLQFLGELPIDYDTFTVTFPIYHASFAEEPAVVLDKNEHVDHKWLTTKQVLALPNLMKDVDKIIQEFCIKKLGMIK